MAFSAEAKPSSSVFPVTPGRQYELSFRARVAAGPTLEEHPEYADLVPLCVSRPTVAGIRFAAVGWSFLDADGKRIARPYEGGQPIALFSREWRQFSERIWIPENVVSIKVSPSPGAKGNKVEVKDVTVRELPADGTLFSTPSFDDAYWPSGWQLVGGALYLTDRNGKGIVSTESGHANSSVFPVVPGSRLAVSVRGAVTSRADRPKFNCWMYFAADYADTLKAKGFRKSMVPVTVVPGKTSVEHEYVVPAGMKWARVAAWNGDLKGLEVKVVK